MIFMALMSAMTLSMNAQEQNDSCKARQEARIAMKANKFANDFGFDDKKRAEFVALYTEYAQALAATRQQCPKAECQKNCQKPCQKDNFSDADANEMINKRLDNAQKRAAAVQKRVDINKKYVERFRKVLTPKQTLKVMQFGNKCKTGKGFDGKVAKGKKFGGKGCFGKNGGKMQQRQMPQGMRRHENAPKPCGQMQPEGCPMDKPNCPKQ